MRQFMLKTAAVLLLASWSSVTMAQTDPSKDTDPDAAKGKCVTIDAVKERVGPNIASSIRRMSDEEWNAFKNWDKSLGIENPPEIVTVYTSNPTEDDHPIWGFNSKGCKVNEGTIPIDDWNHAFGENL